MNEAQEIMLAGMACGAVVSLCCVAIAFLVREIIKGIREQRQPQRLTRIIRPGIV